MKLKLFVLPWTLVLYLHGFTEGSLKWYRECFNRDWVVFNVTGFCSLKILGYKKILYYSIVTPRPFSGHPSLPVAKYITREHTKDSNFFLSA